MKTLHTSWTLSPDEQASLSARALHLSAQEYFAYVREHQRQVLDACILARHGLADPTPAEQAALDALDAEEEAACRPPDEPLVPRLFDEPDFSQRKEETTHE